MRNKANVMEFYQKDHLHTNLIQTYCVDQHLAHGPLSNEDQQSEKIERLKLIVLKKLL